MFDPVKIRSQRLALVDRLSKSTEAEVWRAHDLVAGRDVIYKRTLLPPGRSRDGLLESVRLSRQLSESGFLPGDDLVFAQGQLDGVISRLVEHHDLIRIQRELGDPVVLDILLQICQAMGYLHSLDYLHRDLKPQNVLIERCGDRARAHITDLDWVVRPGSHSLIQFQGTPPYTAPEVAEGKPLTEAADIFSFGRILLEMTSIVRSDDLAGALCALGERCARGVADERPASFWTIYPDLRRMFGLVAGAYAPTVVSPPLREAGTGLRRGRLTRTIAEVAAHGNGLCVVAGPPGIGKSKVMQEHCWMMQCGGRSTLRLEGIASAAEAAGILPETIALLASAETDTGTSPPWCYVHTHPDCEFSSADLGMLESVARSQGAILVVEDRVARQPAEWQRCMVYSVAPLGTRECTVSAAHLLNDQAMAGANGRALYAATGGIPRLIRDCVRSWREYSLAREHIEPVDFDRSDPALTAYWSRRFKRLPPEARTVIQRAAVFHSWFRAAWLRETGIPADTIPASIDVLMRAGWLVRDMPESGGELFEFVSRSARNYVRAQTGDSLLKAWAQKVLTVMGEHVPGGECPLPWVWELQRLAAADEPVRCDDAQLRTLTEIRDWKLAALVLLRTFRRGRLAAESTRAVLARRISDAFAHLHSVRRQERWARRSLQLVHFFETDHAITLDDARLLCRLYTLSRDNARLRDTLWELRDGSTAMDDHTRGYLLSELGAAHILLGEYTAGSEQCFAAHHLLTRAAADSEEYVRNLNRVGLTLYHLGRYEAARKRLEECLSLSLAHGYDFVRSLCISNLVLVNRALGNPRAGMQYSRRAVRYFRRRDMMFDHARGLLSSLLCFVDLGMGYRALRTARLSAQVIVQYLDKTTAAWSFLNLGWVLSMQGKAGQAERALEESVRRFSRLHKDEIVARAVLNLAWNRVLVHEPEAAEALCRQALETLAVRDDAQAGSEAYRILARAAMQREAYDEARAHLSAIPPDDPRIPPRDRTEIALAWADLYLWMGQDSAAKRALDELEGNPMVREIHQMRCDYQRAVGHLHLLQGHSDDAFEVLSRNAADCRSGLRIDKLLDTLILLAMVAAQKGNWVVGLRYLKTTQGMIDSMREELICRPYSRS